MATDLGLFASPEDIQRARSMEMAKMDAGQIAGYMGSQGGAALGRGLGSLFGVDVRDEQMKRADMARELAGKYGVETADAFNKMAMEAQQRGDIPLAMKFREQAQQMSSAANEAAYKKAQTAKLDREADPVADILKSGKFDPKSVAVFERTKNPADLVLAERFTPTEIERLQIYRKKLTDPRQIAEVDAVIKAAGEGKGTKIYNTAEGFDKAITAVAGKAVGDEIASLGKSVSGLSKFERAAADVEKLLPNSFTGMGAGTLTQLNKAAASLGLSKGEKASNTEILTNTFNNIVLPMARQLPGSLAAKELVFLLSTKPATEQEPATIRRLMRQMLQDYRDDKATYEAAQKHRTLNKGSYEGFDINTARYNVGRINDLTSRVQSGTATLDEAMELKKLRSEAK